MPVQRPALLWFFSLAFWLALGATGWAASVEDRLAADRLKLEIGIATLMRALCERNGGAFVGLNRARP